MKKTAKYVIEKTAAGYHTNLHAPNGKIIMTSSKVHPTKQSCEDDITLAQSTEDENIEVAMSRKGGYKFKVMHPTREKSIFKSEVYNEKRGANQGKASVLKNCQTTRVLFNNLTDAPE